MKRTFSLILSLVLALVVVWGMPVSTYAETSYGNIISIDFNNNEVRPVTAGYPIIWYLTTGNYVDFNGPYEEYEQDRKITKDDPHYAQTSDTVFQEGETYYYVLTVIATIYPMNSFNPSVSISDAGWSMEFASTADESGYYEKIIIYKPITVLPAPVNTPYVPTLKTSNYIPQTLTSWEEIVTGFPVIGKDNLELEEESADSLLKVDIVGKEDKTVPSSVVNAMDKSSVYGLHVYIGDSDAVTFFNDLSYVNYTEKKFNHNDTITETGRTIDFTDNGALNATVLLHTVVAPNTNATIYKVVDGKETVVGKVKSTENGRICFGINELATYVIKY